METIRSENLFDVSGQVAVITGGGGVLCSAIAHGLASSGVSTAIVDLKEDLAVMAADEINAAGGTARAYQCDVLSRENLVSTANRIVRDFGRVDILINGAGGNKPQATTGPDLSFFDIPPEAVWWVFNLNLVGTFLPCQIFGRLMADQGSGNIVNISSMNAFRPLTRIPAYSAAKSAVSNFTMWLAVHIAKEYTPEIRVNAIAPGFFLTEQNRYLLTTEENGALTSRGQAIIDHTPQKRFGAPEDLIGTVLWLVSPASKFVTGVVVPIDGGFSAFSGV